ncbi:MAG: FAD-dependent oxidoreductase [Oscillospiraceae bacterium]|jgi:thioredoxin reductase (NADPH)|nr:FAD-dependent oxidoreductase [Oscillospiraceae bacterium]
MEQTIYDVIVVGCGPAGMTAAIYAARANKRVCIIEKSVFGGQITHSPLVENFPGSLAMSGNDFAARMTEQVMSLDIAVEMGNVTAIIDQGPAKLLETEEGSSYRGRTVILATGAKHRTLGLPGEDELEGNGLYYCAVCDGALMKGKHVAVIGGGNSALQEAILLSELGESVTIVQNLPCYTAEMKLREAVEAKPNTSTVFSTLVDGVLLEEGRFAGLRLIHAQTGEKSELRCGGAFVAIGMAPENEIFGTVAALDAQGYFESGEDCTTRTGGVFIAGDCRAKQVRQLTTAVADGAVAALAACRFLGF